MSKKAQENLAVIIMLLVLGLFLYKSFDYSARARMVPVPIAAVTIVLMVIQLALQNTKYGVALNVDASDLFGHAAVPDHEEELAATVHVTKEAGGSELTGLGMVVLFVGLVYLVGMIPSTFLFVAGYFLLKGKQKWYSALLWGALNTGLIYLFFVRILKVQMNEGWILEFLNK